MTGIEALEYETSDKQVTLRVEQWAHLVTILEVANGGVGRVDGYLIAGLQNAICRQLLEDES